MADKKYTMGVLGLGEGRSIISAVLGSDMWELGNICDLNEALCKERVEEFGLTHYTTRYEDMLADPAIDVIGIYTPDQLHATHIKMALEAGKNVLCTKPLMVSLDEAKELIELEKRSGKVVFVGQSSRFFEPLLRQHMDYEAGKHGELVTLEAQYISNSSWFLERKWSHEKGFSWMYNFMIHAVDLAAWYLPEVETVYGACVTSPNTLRQGVDVPDTLKFLFKNKDGKTASVSGIYTLPTLGSAVDQSISCTLRGTEGISRAGYPKLKYYTNFAPVQKTAELHTYDDKHSYYFRFEAENHHAGEYQNYIEYMATCMNKGITPKPDVFEGVHTLGIMEAMSRSIKTGEVIRVADVLSDYGITID